MEAARSDVELGTTAIVLMTDRLEKITTAIRPEHPAQMIVKQNKEPGESNHRIPAELLTEQSH